MKSILRQIVALLLLLAPGLSTADAKEFLLGAELPLTGSLARVGNGTLEGITVGVEIFNRHNPSHKVKLVTIDDESSPAKAVAAVEKLASQGVVAITGGYGSNIIGPASDAANKAGLVYMTSGGVGNELTARGLKHFFRTNGSAGYTKAMAGLFTDMGIKSVSIVYSTKEATTELANDVAKAMRARKAKVAMHPFDPTITDFKPIINKVKLQDRSEAIAMVGYENDYVGILRAAKVLRPATVKAVVGVWSLATPKMAADFPDLMPNVYGTAMLPYPAGFRTAEGKEFADSYKRLYRKEPDYLGQFGYVQAQILCEAIKRADAKGTLAKGGLADEVRRTRLNTLIGQVAFDKNGDNPLFQQRMGQHQNGRIIIVWPKESATGKMNYPAVPW
ncbi:ABC transporter substrate-binding protein [Geobacter sp.]|uniref:ABC transporter substrate-binding protein n=1 Tax=Geobacter sp. TaxID=46610 RepID=UPI00260F6C4F|nr:ABC transporter substrate-binding protein [Geobacter sp.]